MPETVEHVAYIPKDVPVLAAASACFPIELPKSASAAAAQYSDGSRRVLITITVQELP